MRDPDYSRGLEFRRYPDGKWNKQAVGGGGFSDAEILQQWETSYPRYEWRINPPPPAPPAPPPLLDFLYS